METVCVDGEYFDPYHILQVTRDDTDEHIAKSFRNRVRKYHPDKAPSERKKDYTKKFKIIMASYDYIRLKRTSAITSLPHESVQQTTFDESDLNCFNEKFETSRSSDPNSFGYGEHKHISSREEYDDFEVQVVNQFDNKKFDINEFNQLFEYTNTTYSDQSDDSSKALVHKTTDGFWGFNTADTGNCSMVSTFNGLMITGDDSGAKGIGYWGSNYGDYQKSFSTAKNPENVLDVPEEFVEQRQQQMEKYTRNVSKAFSDYSNEYKKSYTRPATNYSQASQQMYSKAVEELEKEQENDREMVLKYSQQYDNSLVQDAMNGKLQTSPSLLSVLNDHYKVKCITQKEEEK